MTYTRLANNVVVEGGTPNTTASVTLGPDNSLFIEIVCFNSSGSGSLTVHLEESNDQENWSAMDDGSGAVTITIAQGISYTKEEFRQASSQYMRLRFDASGTDKFVLAVGIHTASTGAA